jgi:hypothetical protein
MIEGGTIFFAPTSALEKVFSSDPPTPLSTRLLFALGYKALAFLGQGAVRGLAIRRLELRHFCM